MLLAKISLYMRFTSDDTISVDCLLKMVRTMGYDLHYHEVRRLMYLVESSESGVMNEAWPGTNSCLPM